MFKNVIDRVLGQSQFQPPLETSLPPLVDLEGPGLLRLSLCQGSSVPLQAAVKADETVTAGQILAEGSDGFLFPSPVSGTIKAVTDQPDIRGSRKGSAIVVEPSGQEGFAAFPALDPSSAEPDELARRVQEAGILSSMLDPVPLLTQLRPGEDQGVDTVVVLAADRDPGVSIALQQLRERSVDALTAARLVGRIAGAGRVVLAVLESEAGSYPSAEEVEILSLPPIYPESLEALVVRRLQGSQRAQVVPLESALAALDAVREGSVPRTKLLTVIGPDQTPLANYRVPLGTQVRDVLAHAGIEPGERDKIVAGGPMRGFALFSLDGTIDAGVDALTVIPSEQIVAWSAEPCINCGRCIDICPVDLQVQLITRYSEFELFDRTVELEIDECFECGLCGSVCTARRPLLQLIRLAKRELEETA